MDPFIFGLVVMAGASAAAAMRLRRAKAAAATKSARPALPAPSAGGMRVGDVLTHMSDTYWLSAELSLKREGAVAMRLFSAPESGNDRWIALPRDGQNVWVMQVDRALEAIGWPGVEVPIEGGRMLRRTEYGNAAIEPTGDDVKSWEGVGRFALFRGVDSVALFLESANKTRLALRGREIPRQLVHKMG